MSAHTTGQAMELAQSNKILGFVQSYRDDIAGIAASHVRPDTMMRVAVGALSRDDKLMDAARNNPAALISALLEAARLGLEPGTPEYYLTPRKNSKLGKTEIVGIVGYRGEVAMIYRAGAVSSVIVEVVRSNDRFDYVPGRDSRPLHQIDWTRPDRGDLLLAYAYAIMKDGATSKVVVLNKTDIDRHKAASDGAGSSYSPWARWEQSMWMKTAAHQLAKWVPTSAEYRDAPPPAAPDLPAARPRQDPEAVPASADVDAPVDAVIVDEETGEVIA